MGDLDLTFDCVVAADAAGGIGKDSDLPWPRLREDLKFLREITTRPPPDQPGGTNAVIMGRLTWESVPSGKQPLPGRKNVVVSRRPGLELPPGVVAATSLDQALAVPGVAARFVIGGAQLFREAFVHPACRFLYLTRIDARFACDTFLPPHDDFELEEVLARHREHDIDFTINRLRRRRRAGLNLRGVSLD